VGALTALTKPIDSIEVHDPALLAAARDLLDHCRSPEEMADSVVAAVKRNEEWRSKRCINLLSFEAPSGPCERCSQPR
jgi:glycine hydroxymethyltransferase